MACLLVLGPTLADDRVQTDWPALGRYHAQNAALPAPAPGQARVVFLGDSITEFWSKEAPDPFSPDSGWINRGISAQTTPQMLLRLRQDVIALRPQVVVILAGTNDIAGNTGKVTPETIQGNLASMAELARVHGIRVVMASVLPVTRYWWARDVEPKADITALNTWIRDYATREGHVHLDYFSAMATAALDLNPAYSDDGVHPNAAGYRVMTPLAQEAIRRALAHPLAAPR